MCAVFKACQAEHEGASKSGLHDCTLRLHTQTGASSCNAEQICVTCERQASSHRQEDKLSGVVNEGLQPSQQVDALGTALHTVVEDLNKVLQAVLVHGVNEGQVSQDKVQDGTALWDCLVLLSGQVYLSLGVLCLLDSL